MTQNQAWIVLIIAGIFEVGWAIGLKYTESFTKIIPSSLTIAAMIISMYLLGKATHILPIGTAYAVWVGIGTVGASVLGILILKEPINIIRIISIAFIILGIIGLKITTA